MNYVSTKIEIRASEQNIQSTYGEKNYFSIPDYQRPYSWNKEHWTDLWNDLDSINSDETHFLGSVVVIKHDKPHGKLDELEVIDGQQRLTTVSLFLSAIRDRYDELGSFDQIVELIEDDQLYEKDNSGTKRPKITLSRLDDDDYVKILEQRRNAIRGDSKILDAYKFYRNKIKNFDKAELDIIRTKLISSLTIVLVECEDESSAFRLFETLNDRGLELSAIDLMKNSLLQRVSTQYGPDSTEYDHVKKQWEYLLDEVVRELSHPDRFFRHFMMANSTIDREGNISKSKLYDEFSDIIKNELPKKDTTVIDYIDQMVDVSDLYMGITHASVDVFDGRPQQKINNHLQNLNDLKSSHSQTLILRAFEEFNEYSDMVDVLNVMEDFTTRITIMDVTTGAKQDKLFSNLCSQAFQKSDPIKDIKEKLREEAPSDEEFKAKFASSSYKMNDLTKYLLETLEREHYISGGSGKVRDRTSVDIEHIAPRSALESKKYTSWKSIIKVSKADYKSNYRDRIGNLTLLEEKLNEEASANPFQEKLDKYRLSEFEMTRAIRDEYSEWGIQEIDDRSEKLAEYAVKVWDIS